MIILLQRFRFFVLTTFICACGHPHASALLSPITDEGGLRQIVQIGPTSIVTTVAFSPNGSLVLSSGEDGTLKLWDVSTGREIRTFTGHAKKVFSVAFSPDGQFALSGSEDRSMKLWDIATGSEIRTFTNTAGSVSHHAEPVYHVAFSPDGRSALSCGDNHWLTLWDVGALV